jgi:hypothetical protein
MSGCVVNLSASLPFAFSMPFQILRAGLLGLSLLAARPLQAQLAD